MNYDQISVVYLGTPSFALAPLQKLIEHERFDVVAVLTQEDKKVGRKRVLTAPPVKELALDHDIPVLQPTTLKKNPEIQTVLEGLEPDLFVVVAYGQILPPEILEIPKFGAVNIHPSLLPKYRGPSPIQSAIKNGDQETGIAFMQLNDQMDAGPVLLMQRLTIKPNENSEELLNRTSAIASETISQVLIDYTDGILTPIPQHEEDATYCSIINNEDGALDLHNMTSEEIINYIRAFTPWPQCHIEGGGHKLKILEAEASSEHEVPPATLIDIDKRTIGIGTKKGVLIPKRVQLQGKKPMSIQDFLLGNRAILMELLANAK